MPVRMTLETPDSSAPACARLDCFALKALVPQDMPIMNLSPVAGPFLERNPEVIPTASSQKIQMDAWYPSRWRTCIPSWIGLNLLPT